VSQQSWDHLINDGSEGAVEMAALAPIARKIVAKRWPRNKRISCMRAYTVRGKSGCSSTVRYNTHAGQAINTSGIHEGPPELVWRL